MASLRASVWLAGALGGIEDPEPTPGPVSVFFAALPPTSVHSDKGAE